MFITRVFFFHMSFSYTTSRSNHDKNSSLAFNFEACPTRSCGAPPSIYPSPHKYHFAHLQRPVCTMRFLIATYSLVCTRHTPLNQHKPLRVLRCLLANSEWGILVLEVVSSTRLDDKGIITKFYSKAMRSYSLKIPENNLLCRWPLGHLVMLKYRWSFVATIVQFKKKQMVF